MFLHLSVSHSVLPKQVPPGRYTPWAGAPPWAGTPPWQVHAPTGTPPEQVHPGQVHPLAGTPPPPEQFMLGDMGNKWAVRILLECILSSEIILVPPCSYISKDS